MATFLPILVQLLTVIKNYVQSADGVSHITTERFNAMFASVGVTSNVVK